MENRRWIDFMKDYYALALVLILNLTLFYLLYNKMMVLINVMKELNKVISDNSDKISGLRSEVSAQITELNKLSDLKGASTNKWENAKNAFRTMPWGRRVENE